MITAIRDLRRERYGAVGVSFAQPISLGELLDAEGAKDMDDWLADKSLRRRSLTELSRQIAERINGAVHLNPVAVVATALLATPKHAADAAQLASIVERMLRLVSQSHSAPEAVLTKLSGAEAIAYTARMGYLTRKSHPLGDVVLAEPAAAVLKTAAALPKSLATSSSLKQRSGPKWLKMPTLKATREYPKHSRKKAPFAAGWRACAGHQPGHGRTVRLYVAG